jgi:hypothetical protein
MVFFCGFSKELVSGIYDLGVFYFGVGFDFNFLFGMR